jgi:Protein of unknown function (DUF763)
VIVKRSGFADLPLHGGRVPPWLADRMTKLGTAISENILMHYGRSELLTRLSDPHWFQALSELRTKVLGSDWVGSCKVAGGQEIEIFEFGDWKARSMACGSGSAESRRPRGCR